MARGENTLNDKAKLPGATEKCTNKSIKNLLIFFLNHFISCYYYFRLVFTSSALNRGKYFYLFSLR